MKTYEKVLELFRFQSMECTFMSTYTCSVNICGVSQDRVGESFLCFKGVTLSHTNIHYIIVLYGIICSKFSDFA